MDGFDCFRVGINVTYSLTVQEKHFNFMGKILESQQIS